MKIGKKLSAVLAAGIISLSMAAPSFAQELYVGDDFEIYKDVLAGEKFSVNHAQDCFESITIEDENLVNVDTKKITVMGFDGYITYMKLTSLDYTTQESSFIDDAEFDDEGGLFEFKKGIKPFRFIDSNTNTNKTYYKGSVKIKVMGHTHKPKDLDIVLT